MFKVPHDGPAARFIGASVLFGGFCLWLVQSLGQGGAAAALSLGVFGAVVVVGLRGVVLFYPHRHLGLCNLVTLFRAAMVAVIAAAVSGPSAVEGDTLWLIVALAAVTLALDGVDGWLARSSGLVSGFGARFDMEVDSLFALILALAVWQSDKVGLWVLLLGSMRYLFVIAMIVWPWIGTPVPVAILRRKTVCVIQIAALVVLLAPVVQPPVAVWIAATATAALIWSFAADIVWLYRRRAA